MARSEIGNWPSLTGCIPATSSAPGKSSNKLKPTTGSARNKSSLRKPGLRNGAKRDRKRAEAHGLHSGNLQRAGKIVQQIEANHGFSAEQIQLAKARLEEWREAKPERN